jgi:hypothetical protein
MEVVIDRDPTEPTDGDARSATAGVEEVHENNFRTSSRTSTTFRPPGNLAEVRLTASLLAALLGAGCLSTPARPRDDASEVADVTADTAKAAPGFVGRTAGSVTAMSGSLAIPPPPAATAGNLVLLYLDRFWADTELAATSGWHSVAFVTFQLDAPQIFYRVAAANEATLIAEYTFPAGTLGSPPDGSWVLDVWRDASSAQMVFATTSPAATATPTFPAVAAMANEVVVNASVADYETTCSEPAGIDDRVLWSLFANAPGSVSDVSFMCEPARSFSRFQVRIVP